MDKVMSLINIIVSFLESFGIVGGFIIILLESIIPMMPLGVFIGLNAEAYGFFIGFCVSYIATVIGCMISFAFFRLILNKYFFKIFKNKKRKEAINNWMNKLSNIKLSSLVMILAMPFVPAFVINIAAGLSAINARKYLLALLISKISTILFWGYIGTSLIESLKKPIILLEILGILIGAYIISRIVEKISKVEGGK